jgi:hypothetical protein
MITNMNYLKTALEALESDISPMTQVKILGTIKFICEQNIDRIETDLVDKVDARLYNKDTERAKGAQDDGIQNLGPTH